VSSQNGSGPAALVGRRALVTGAASGIGLATARHLASLGAEIFLTDRPGDGLEAISAELEAGSFAADLADREDVARLLEVAGPVEVLVNNAGLQHVDAVKDFPDDRWDTLLAVMLTAPFLLARGTLPHMLDTGWGRIVNIASVHGLVASPYKAAYVAAKHGLVGLTKTIALEAAAACPDVTAHAVCPTYVRTPLVEAQIEAQASAHGIAPSAVVSDVLLERNAVKRLIEPEQVAEVVGHLCGPAAWAMTGAVVPMDAGWLAH
jgi:3-hydroxybutyrate dehydrogenase